MAKEAITFKWLHPDLNPLLYDKENLVPTNDHAYEIRRNNPRVSNAITDIQSKIDIIHYHKQELDNRLNEYKDLLPKLILDFQKESSGFSPSQLQRMLKNRHCYNEFYDYRIISHLDGILVQTKAFLDSYAQLYSIAFNRDLRSFKNKGTKLVNDINNLSKSQNEFKSQLLDHITSAKVKWIDDAIDYRNSVVHYGSLKDLHLYRLELNSKNCYTVEMFKKPIMPNKKTVRNYTNNLVKNVTQFCQEGLIIFFNRFKVSENETN